MGQLTRDPISEKNKSKIPSDRGSPYKADAVYPYLVDIMIMMILKLILPIKANLQPPTISQNTINMHKLFINPHPAYFE